MVLLLSILAVALIGAAIYLFTRKKGTNLPQGPIRPSAPPFPPPPPSAPAPPAM